MSTDKEHKGSMLFTRAVVALAFAFAICLPTSAAFATTPDLDADTDAPATTRATDGAENLGSEDAQEPSDDTAPAALLASAVGDAANDIADHLL